MPQEAHTAPEEQDQNENLLPLFDASEPVQDIIGRQPRWIVRWGNTVLVVTVVMLLYLTWLIKYPEVVTAPITITAQTPPIRVVSRASGKIVTFFVQDEEQVTAGDYLALLDNTADYEDVLNLKLGLEEINGFLMAPEKFLDREWPRDLELGDMQNAYADFLKSWYLYRAHVDEDFNRRKIQTLQAQIGQHRALAEKLGRQEEILKQDLDLAFRKFENKRKLHEQKMFSAEDLATAEGLYLEKRYDVESAGSAVINNRIQIETLERAIMDLQQTGGETRRELVLETIRAYKRLLHEFETWEQNYVLTAPSDGFVSVFKYWSDNQYVTSGEEVLTIVPDPDTLVGKIYFPQYGAGRIEKDQRVQIKFESFPFREYGMVIGRVNRVSRVARNDQYLVDVALENGLETTYNKRLEFKHNMLGTADIITKEMRLIERIFNQFRYFIERNRDQEETSTVSEDRS